MWLIFGAYTSAVILDIAVNLVGFDLINPDVNWKVIPRFGVGGDSITHQVLDDAEKVATLGV